MPKSEVVAIQMQPDSFSGAVCFKSGYRFIMSPFECSMPQLQGLKFVVIYLVSQSKYGSIYIVYKWIQEGAWECNDGRRTILPGGILCGIV